MNTPIEKIVLKSENELKKIFDTELNVYGDFEYTEKPIKYPVCFCYWTYCGKQDKKDNLVFCYVYPDDFQEVMK